MELEVLRHKYHQAEKEIDKLKEVEREHELLKQTQSDTNKAYKELSDEHYSLQRKKEQFGECHKQREETSLEKKSCEKSVRQLEAEVMDLKTKNIKYIECHKKLQETNSDKRVYESLNKNLTEEIHKLDRQLVALNEKNKSIHSQLCSEREKNMKLTAENHRLQLDYDALESQYSKVKVDKARLEESNKYNFILLVTLLSVLFTCACCVPCGNAREPALPQIVRAIAN